MTTTRKFPKRDVVICYDSPPATQVDRQHYDALRQEALQNLVEEIVIPKKSARTWTLKAGDLCRISVIEGSQVCLTIVDCVRTVFIIMVTL